MVRRPGLSLNLPLTIVVLCWGFNFVAVKVLQPEMSVRALSVVRFLTMFALLVAYCLLRGESLVPKKGDAGKILLAGFVSMGIYMVLFLEGLSRTGAAEGAIVLATAPVLTYLLSCALKHEQFHPIALVGSVLAFFGVSLVILGGASGGHGSVVGDLIVLASAFTWAASAVMMKPLLLRYRPTQLFTMSLPGGFPLLLWYGLDAALHTNYAAISLKGWAMFGQIAVFSGVIAFACFYEGVRQVGASRATRYQYFVPPTAALFGWMMTGKALGSIQFVGLLVVLTGVIIASRGRTPNSGEARLQPVNSVA